MLIRVSKFHFSLGFLFIATFILAACSSRPQEPLETAVSVLETATATLPATAQSEPTATNRPEATEILVETAVSLPPTSPVELPEEAPVIEIPLTGPAAQRDSEISGMAWYGDYLILIPQFPGRFDNHLFGIPKADILAFLDGESDEPLSPIAIPFVAPELNRLKGYEGLEAVAFVGDQVFVTVETSGGSPMLGYLVGGSIAPDLSEVRLDTANRVEIEPQVNLSNSSDETLLIVDDRLVTIYEANGQNVNPNPIVHLFDMELVAADEIGFPAIEYRITDATAVDAQNRFWAINYLFPGDVRKLVPARDPLAELFGEGKTHGEETAVERLVEFQYDPNGITFTDAAPIQLELLSNHDARNWEGVVRLDERDGFLLATDKFPTTILAFIQTP